MKRILKEERGITLIALVVTIVVLLILAGVSIKMLTGDNGILNKANEATEENRKQTAAEKMNLKITNIQIKSYAEKEEMPTLQYLADGLCEDEEMEYVLLESKKSASLDKITIGEESSIFTKLKEYPYEFEIDAKLRLASINGVKIADNNNALLERIENLESEIESLKNSSTPMIDTSRRLKELTIGEEYVATEDCIFAGYINTKPVGWWTLSVDDVQICSIGQNGAANCGITFPNVFIKKGSKIQIGGSDSSYYHNALLQVFGVK